MNTILEQLENRRLVWRANQQQQALSQDQTGYQELDEALQGGFPQHGVVDIDSPVGIGELRLLLPALKARQQSASRLLVFIAPPMLINGEMLAEQGFALEQILVIQPESAGQALWSAEQCLKSGCCHSVLLWHQHLEVHHAKRLQLAAEQGDAVHFIFRHGKQIQLSLPVSLAMKMRAQPHGLSVQITKRKGGWPNQAFTLDMRQQWPELTLQPNKNNIVAFPQAKVS